MSQTRYFFSATETVRYRFPTHTNNLVMDRSEAQASEVFIGVVEPGEVPLIRFYPLRWCGWRGGGRRACSARASQAKIAPGHTGT
jgi:hypothetical protein